MLVQEGDLAVADHAGLVDADPGKIPDDHDELVFRVVGLGQVEDAGVGAAEGDVGEGGVVAVGALPVAAAVLLAGFADPRRPECGLVVEPGEVPRLRSDVCRRVGRVVMCSWCVLVRSGGAAADGAWRAGFPPLS